MSEYKLVPVEPTTEMLDEGHSALVEAHKVGMWGECPGISFSEAEEAYRAMLAAAPSPEWVKTSDRLPTREDADEIDHLWAGGPGFAFVSHREDAKYYPYWLPKPRVQPPEPPEGE